MHSPPSAFILADDYYCHFSFILGQCNCTTTHKQLPVRLPSIPAQNFLESIFEWILVHLLVGQLCVAIPRCNTFLLSSRGVRRITRKKTTFLSHRPHIIACSYKTSKFQHIRSCCSETSLHRKRGVCLGRLTVHGKFDLVFPTPPP